MTNAKIGPLAPSIYCVHQRIAVQIAAAVDADQPDWRNRLAVVIARHLDAAAGRADRIRTERTSPLAYRLRMVTASDPPTR
jgi:hypothetical protein